MLVRNMAIAALAVLTLVFAPSVGRAQAGTVVVPYENMVSVLSAYHGMPGKDYWAKLNPEATRATLIGISNDEKLFPAVRARAMLALAYFKNDEAVSLVVKKSKGDLNPYIRATAIEALAALEGEKAVTSVGPGLEDVDVMVRISAIRALKKIGTPEAKKTLEGAMATEKNPTARSILQKSLGDIR
ncbi:MAG: HEAT repeat domain-containing protein [Nitrospinae bacterium]|nr:HEAT repeat domain-containing protein [Nitrospinota bacterium]